MESPFSLPTKDVAAAGLFRSGVVLAQGGGLNQAAIAALDKGTAPNGTPGEPEIVQTGIRQPNLMDAKTRTGLMYLGAAVLIVVLIAYHK